MTIPTTTHPCDRCDQPATVDFGRARQVPGLHGLVQRLCCRHAVGLRGHRGCTACAPAHLQPGARAWYCVNPEWDEPTPFLVLRLDGRGVHGISFGGSRAFRYHTSTAYLWPSLDALADTMALAEADARLLAYAR